MSQKRRTAADEAFLVVRSTSSDPAPGSVISDHAHDWHQLIYVSAGLMVVTTEAGAWVAPPSWSVWVPAGTRHAIRFVGESRFRTLYFRATSGGGFPGQCCSLAVSPFLRELILRTLEHGMLDRRDPVEAALALLVREELGRIGPPPFALTRPTSQAALAAARLLEANAPEAARVATLARAVGLGPRTLERRFREETGLTPRRWQLHCNLLSSLERLAAGAMVKTVASEAGFASPSAYVAAFRRVFGITPASYFATSAPEPAP